MGWMDGWMDKCFVYDLLMGPMMSHDVIAISNSLPNIIRHGLDSHSTYTHTHTHTHTQNAHTPT